jgi:hypothetical protein
MAGSTAGRADSNGRWVNDLQNGYYGADNRWHAGATSGYYDGQGRWIARPSGNGGHGMGMPSEIRAREAWLERYIRSASSEGRLNRPETNRPLLDLNSIRRSERGMQRDRQGNLSIRNEAAINVRLDRLSRQLRIANFADGRRY